jgi:hypothetical protein
MRAKSDGDPLVKKRPGVKTTDACGQYCDQGLLEAA